MRLSIPFSDIPEQGLTVNLTDMSWFPEDVVTRAGDIATDLVLSKKGETKVELRGSLDMTVLLQCDRCLADFKQHIDSPFQVILEVPDSAHHWRVQDIEVGEADIETITLTEPVVELGEILRDQVLLALPGKQVCSDACAGLCSGCGKNLNEGPCQCGSKEVNSPFSVLAQYKKES